MEDRLMKIHDRMKKILELKTFLPIQCKVDNSQIIISEINLSENDDFILNYKFSGNQEFSSETVNSFLYFWIYKKISA